MSGYHAFAPIYEEWAAHNGWFDRRPFDDRSPEFVWIARRLR